jgi:hypothetical protein
VTHFFDLMNCSSSLAGTRWAALFYGEISGAHFSEMRLE